MLIYNRPLLSYFFLLLGFQEIFFPKVKITLIYSATCPDLYAIIFFMEHKGRNLYKVLTILQQGFTRSKKAIKTLSSSCDLFTAFQVS